MTTDPRIDPGVLAILRRLQGIARDLSTGPGSNTQGRRQGRRIMGAVADLESLLKKGRHQ